VLDERIMLMKDLLKATVLMLMDWVGSMKCFNQLCYRKYLCSGWAVICVWDGRKGGWCKCIKGEKYHKVSKKLIVFSW